MKEVELNPLDQNQRRILQFGVILVLILFLIGYFFFINKKTAPTLSSSKTVYLQDSKLYVFDNTYIVKQYPDRVVMHYPYLLIVQADKPLTIIYNLETKKKEKEINDVLLDYYQGNTVSNRKESYFNDQNLDKYCESAFIKSNNEILCITKQTRDSMDNMLISINPDKPNLWKRMYQSKNLLTTLSVINDNLYIGEIDSKTRQNYLTVNGTAIPVNDVVSLIYPMKENVYQASFKSSLNNNKESHFLIKNNGEITKQGEGKIVLY